MIAGEFYSLPALMLLITSLGQIKSLESMVVSADKQIRMLLTEPREGIESHCNRKNRSQTTLCSLNFAWRVRGEIKDVCAPSYDKWYQVERYYFISIDCELAQRKISVRSWRFKR